MRRIGTLGQASWRQNAIGNFLFGEFRAAPLCTYRSESFGKWNQSCGGSLIWRSFRHPLTAVPPRRTLRCRLNLDTDCGSDWGGLKAWFEGCYGNKAAL